MAGRGAKVLLNPGKAVAEEQALNEAGIYFSMAVWIFSFALAIYLVGFMISTPLFVGAYMKRHGARWLSVVLTAGIFTGVSFIGGYGYDQKLIEKMKERNGNLPTTTTTTSVIEALKKLGIKKVSIATPYVEQVSRTVIKFVEDSGIEVLNAKWLNKGTGIDAVPKETIYHLAAEVDDPASEAVFISCVNLHTIEIIEKLEKDLQKPVVTSNQATMWNILRMANIKDSIQGYGRLLADY